jgi:CRISPR-associated protein, Cse1 family
MTISFNLIEEKWIPCLGKNKDYLLLNIREVISQAHNLTGLAADLPIMNAAMFLFLLAFTSSAHPMKDLEDWDRLYQNSRFPEAATEEYINRWHDRFDLFDQDHPFYQDPKFGMREKDLQNLKTGESPVPKSIKGLLMHLSSGSNATLFDHSMDAEDKWYSLVEVAQILVLIQPYSLGGMTAASIGKDKYYKDSAFSRGITFFCRGANLFESLLQNMIPAEQDVISRGTGNHPCWQKDDPFANSSGVPEGLLDLLTLQSRRILLIPESISGQVMVKDWFSAPGLHLIETFANPYYLNSFVIEKGVTTFKPLRFRTNGVIWRDSTAILDKNPMFSDLPISRKLFDNLIDQGILQNEKIRLDLYGMITEPGKKITYDYVHERFDAPTIYLEDPDLHLRLQEALTLAENVRTALYFATSTLASFKIYPDQDVNEGMSPDKKMVGALYNHINMEQRFWGTLESHFYQLLNQLPQDGNAMEDWKSALRKAAVDSLAAAAEMTGEDASSLKARAKAEMQLGYKLREAFNPEQKESK